MPLSILSQTCMRALPKTLAVVYMMCSTMILHAQHKNVLIKNTGSPHEVSICINPRNTQQIVAGANLANVLYSHDGGETWSLSAVSSSFGIWGDPMIGVDTSGAFYYLHLSNPPNGNWIDRIVSQKSTDGGVHWTDGTYMGLNGQKAQDKHWMAVDRNSNILYVTWTQFDRYGSASPTDSSQILFSRSVDGGNSWSPAVRINKKAGDCIDSDDTAEGAVPAVGPHGEIYVCWALRDSLWFDMSVDSGKTWLENDKYIGPQYSGWDINISGISRANGLPVTDCDLSGSPYHGTIYINYADRNAITGDQDIWLIKSVDNGNTWSDRIRVNDDATVQDQFFTWMAVDQATGYLWFVFYDRRNYNDNRTDVFMAVSRDGGTSFQNFKVSESPFTPNGAVFFGDYNGISAHNNVVRPIWTRMDNTTLSIWTALIDTDSISTFVETAPDEAFAVGSAFPNPFSEGTQISFKLRRASVVSLFIMDLQGRILARPIENETRGYGAYIESLNFRSLGLANGVYFLVLNIDGILVKRRIMQID